MGYITVLIIPLYLIAVFYLIIFLHYHLYYRVIILFLLTLPLIVYYRLYGNQAIDKYIDISYIQ